MRLRAARTAPESLRHPCLCLFSPSGLPLSLRSLPSISLSSLSCFPSHFMHSLPFSLYSCLCPPSLLFIVFFSSFASFSPFCLCHSSIVYPFHPFHSIPLIVLLSSLTQSFHHLLVFPHLSPCSPLLHHSSSSSNPPSFRYWLPKTWGITRHETHFSHVSERVVMCQDDSRVGEGRLWCGNLE